ncbi:NADP-dependent oxidoreductase [Haloglycomyces albus]|uniref:NADP-dependent oxidoreductase n=1 Tax=Haloglycomyces albus TaxID=526067 RepID=UPI00046CA201|nr:NADP-dependent oxidoreductase [Haloglycomyces albus]
MRAIAADGTDSDPVLSEVSEPQMSADDIRVAVKAAAVNPFDWKLARGEIIPDMERHWPFVYGSDFAGVVTETGSNVNRFAPGDRVFGQYVSHPAGHGTYAEIVTVPEKSAVTTVPEPLDLISAASLPTSGMTAQQILEAAELQAGENLLIIGAAGGVGSFLTQLAAARDLRVIAVTKGDESARMGSLGAARTIDRTVDNVGAAVRDESPGGVDALVDLSSHDSTVFAQHCHYVRDGGVALTTNWVSDDSINPSNIETINFGLEANAGLLDTVAAATVAGTIQAPVDFRLSLSDVPAHLEFMRAGKGRGKAVIVVDDEA